MNGRVIVCYSVVCVGDSSAGSFLLRISESNAAAIMPAGIFVKKAIISGISLQVFI